MTALVDVWQCANKKNALFEAQVISNPKNIQK